MRLITRWTAIALLVSLRFLPGCASDDGENGSEETSADVAPGDTETEAETEPGKLLPDLLEPAILRAGVATSRMPLPVGIPISGNGPGGCPKGPYAKNYPANDLCYTSPGWKVIALEGGLGRMIFVRADLIGADAYTRQDIVERLLERTGQDFSDTLIFGATHTHSGPARMSKSKMFEFVQDEFLPDHYERMIESLITTILKAFEDLEPARLGYAIADGEGLHNDRRCEDGLHEDHALPVLRVDRTDGSTKAALVVFAIHGTVIGADECTLSQDVSGGLESKLEEHFDENVPVVFFNSWAGDSSPGHVPVDTTGSVVKNNYSRIEALGNAFAERVLNVWDDMDWMEGVVELEGKTRWIPLSREALGYADGEYPFPYGGMYCGGSIDSPCWDDPEGGQPIPNLDKGCLPLTEELAAPGNTAMTAARIGDLYITTFPGEPVTEIAEAVVAGIHQIDADLKVLFLGYTQDYCGYSTPEYNWWLGGYEASGSMWGPKQGDYLTARAIEVMQAFLDPQHVLSWEEPPPRTVTPNEVTVRTLIASIDPGVWSQQPMESYGPQEMIEAIVEGGEAWFGLPKIILEKEVDGAFVAVKRANGTVVANDGYEMETELVMDPLYVEARDASERHFYWVVRLPTTRPAATTTAPFVGTFRLRAMGTAYKDGAEQAYDVASTSFDISE